MTIETRTWLYEALIRFSPDGYAGAQQTRMQTVRDTETGTILSEKTLDAEPVSDTAIAALVGEQIIAMGQQIETLQKEVAALGATKGDAQPEP